MCAYYRRFIARFSQVAGPLHDLTKKSIKYLWTAKEQKAFDMLKEKLTTQPVLKYRISQSHLRSNVMHVEIALELFYSKKSMP